MQLLADLIEDELNVRDVERTAAGTIFRLEVKPHFKTMGPAFGKEVNQVAGVIRGLNDEAMGRLASGHGVSASVDGKEITILPDHVEVVRHPKEGLAVSEAGGLVVALETALTRELTAEGQVRELVHRLQGLRKDQGLAVTDRIHVEYCASPNLDLAVQTHKDLIMAETLARSLLKSPESLDGGTKWDLDGESFQVSIRLAPRDG